MTQNEQILRHIRLYGSITPLEALKEYGIMRLASRVSDLKKAGIPIKSEMVTYINKSGKPIRFSKYSLGGETN